MDTQDLINVLRKYQNKTEVILQKDNNAESFWPSFVMKIYTTQKLEQMYINNIPENNAYGLRSEISADYLLKDLLNKFQQDGDSLDLVNKQGRLLKRFAKFYKENIGLKLSDEVQGILGDTLQYFINSQSVRTYVLDFTDSIDWEDGYFGKFGSCWWGTCSDSIPTFENGGGWGVRFYADLDDRRGIGRTWILPKYDMLLCFNSYGVDRPQVSKCIKQIFAREGITLHYKKVEIRNSYDSEIPYINSGTGFILYFDGVNEDSLDDNYDVDLEIIRDETKSTCDNCGDRYDNDDLYFINGESYCESCKDRLFGYCERCEEYLDQNEINRVDHRNYTYLCDSCIEHLGMAQCTNCEIYTSDYIITDEDNVYCENCNHFDYCESCDTYHEDNCPNEDSDDDTESISDTPENEPEVLEYDFLEHNLETVQIWNETKTINVYRHSLISGLFMYYDDNAWHITHESSGLRICRPIPESWQAVEIMNRVQDVNWTLDKDVIVSNSVITNHVVSVVRDITGTY